MMLDKVATIWLKLWLTVFLLTLLAIPAGAILSNNGEDQRIVIIMVAPFIVLTIPVVLTAVGFAFYEIWRKDEGGY